LHIAGVNIVDVVTNTVLWKSSLTVIDGRISAIGSAPPQHATVLELPGCWVSPGLVDVHAHVTFEPRAHYDAVSFSYGEDSDFSVLRGIRNLTEAARLGICLVRDVGGRDRPSREVRELANSGKLNLPYLVTAGEPLCIEGGHGSEFGQVIAESDAFTLQRYLRSHREAGHEWLKIMNGPEHWDAADLSSIIDVAHSEGLKVAVHAFTPQGIHDAVQAKANTLEHAMLSDRSLIMAAINNSIAFVPTYYCSWLSLRPRFTWTQHETELSHLEFWRALLCERQGTHVASGIITLPGTDAGCAPCTFDDYFQELEQFRLWGMPQSAILHSASIAAARVLGKTEDFGSVTEGKWANIIVTEKSPIEAIAHLRNPVLTLLKGVDVVNHLGEQWT
jgi:imidazolonepropionase-like amidohydrolase